MFLLEVSIKHTLENIIRSRGKFNKDVKKTNQSLAFKGMIDVRTKGIGRKEYLTMWSQGIVQFLVQHLRNKLLQMILDPHLKSNMSPEIQLEKRKVLPKLVEVAPYALIKDKEKYQKRKKFQIWLKRGENN